jgi:hypothetical protein
VNVSLSLSLSLSPGITGALDVGHADFPPLDIQAAVDPSTVFIEAELDAFHSPVFDQF